MDHITKPVSDVDAAVKPNAEVSMPAQGNGLATNFEPGTATPRSPAAVPNGGKVSSAWWDHIKALDHYDPAYPYDPRHVYGPDWTDDDAYGKDGVTFMVAPAHQTSVHGCRDEAQRRLGRGHVFQERCLRLPDLGVPNTNRYAQSGQIIPDVFIQEHPRLNERRHEVVYDPDNPILFVLEVLSESTFHHDLEPKVEIYRAMGVREFWRYDPERWHRREGEPRLWGLRLSAEGEYETLNRSATRTSSRSTAAMCWGSSGCWTRAKTSTPSRPGTGNAVSGWTRYEPGTWLPTKPDRRQYKKLLPGPEWRPGWRPV